MYARKIEIHNLEAKMILINRINLKKLKKYLKENMPRYNKIWGAFWSENAKNK